MAESFGVDAQRYDQARPGYPDTLVTRIVTGSPGSDVLDVGCGTGIAARQFQAVGCTVLGIEADARMADFARARGLQVEVATFEAWEPVGRTFDAVIAAQSWHWVEPVAGVVKAARVLRPGGRLAIFGHAYEPPTEVAEPFAAAYRRAAPDTPRSTANRPDVRSASTRRHTRSSPTRSARPNSSTLPNSGDSTGSSPTRATSGWTCYPPPAASPNSVPISWTGYWTRSGAPSTPWADASQ
ncbi:SAM-dependent methyltransferase [Streptomyces sp. V4I8]